MTRIYAAKSNSWTHLHRKKRSSFLKVYLWAFSFKVSKKCQHDLTAIFFTKIQNERKSSEKKHYQQENEEKIVLHYCVQNLKIDRIDLFPSTTVNNDYLMNYM
jgi:hypothetical protein